MRHSRIIPSSSSFPRIPGVNYTALMTRPAVINFNVMPPPQGAPYPVFLSKTEAGGSAIAGIHLPTLEAPIATHTGWNLRKTGCAEGELCESNGSMLSFAATRDERLVRTLVFCSQSDIRNHGIVLRQSQKPQGNLSRIGSCWKRT
jgi:hypothetical protein